MLGIVGCTPFYDTTLPEPADAEQAEEVDPVDDVGAPDADVPSDAGASDVRQAEDDAGAPPDVDVALSDTRDVHTETGEDARLDADADAAPACVCELERAPVVCSVVDGCPWALCCASDETCNPLSMEPCSR